ncbi:jg25410 [Pararge aegeria aegeria]|uniref:Jg25410 protein n=1 Tax=Pararge aegeria aegeria TaxID=348720 RepID=A0A8S4QRP2_9NEOP|nr:jg25410 [Pararge aegeria aegeria]
MIGFRSPSTITRSEEDLPIVTVERITIAPVQWVMWRPTHPLLAVPKTTVLYRLSKAAPSDSFDVVFFMFIGEGLTAIEPDGTGEYGSWKGIPDPSGADQKRRCEALRLPDLSVALHLSVGGLPKLRLSLRGPDLLIPDFVSLRYLERGSLYRPLLWQLY